MKRVKYDGPKGQVCFEVGEAIAGSALLLPGEVYELPEELAKRLLASSPWWSVVKPEKKTTTKE